MGAAKFAAMYYGPLDARVSKDSFRRIFFFILAVTIFVTKKCHITISDQKTPFILLNSWSLKMPNRNVSFSDIQWDWNM